MQRLIDIVAKLRSPEGCPWDRKQTHSSLIDYLLEETWEVIEEIENDRVSDPLKEELGDLMLQIVLHAQIAQEESRFDIKDVVDTISDKMINRHPHVFDPGDRSMTDKELRNQWLQIKKTRKVELRRSRESQILHPPC